MPDDTADQNAGTQAAADDTDVDIADTAREPAGDDHADDESGLDDKAKAALDKVRREARNLRQRLRELEPAARQLKEIQDKDKSESQRLTEQLAEKDKKIAEFELREVRVDAAAAAGLPPNMAKFITATDPDEAKAQAKQLAEFGKSGQNSVDLKQGARRTTPQKPTGDEFLRRMAGRQ